MRALGTLLPLVTIAACTLTGPRPPAPPTFPATSYPTLLPQEAMYNSHVVALRTSLGRAGVRLEMRGAVEKITATACTDRSAQIGCSICELAGEGDALDADVIDALTAAFDRYPADVLEATHIERVALCRQLTYTDVADRGTVGTVDLKERRLVISVKPFLGQQYDANGTTTTEDIVHHELFHLFEYERMRDKYVDDPAWYVHNPPGFAYRDPSDGKWQPSHGFVDPYATTNDHEDRASVYQYMMARPDELCVLTRGDPLLATKVRVIWQRIAAVTDDTFLRRRALCGASTLAPSSR